jgi:hypothetical protein
MYEVQKQEETLKQWMEKMIPEMLEYEDYIYHLYADAEEKRLFYPEFERYDVTVTFPKRAVKKLYHKKKAMKRHGKD